jgi:dynein heavy chain
VHDYGENFFKGIEPSDEWKDRANDARDLICQYLVINNKATLKIMKIWEKYEGFSFVVLPNKIDPSMRIIDFINI